MPSTTLTNNSGMDFQFQMEENVSTTALIAQKQFPILMADALRRLGQEIKKAVKEEYENKRTTYGNSPTTIIHKGMGKPALEDTGALRHAVTTWDDNEIKVVQTGNNYTLEVDWSMPQSGGTGVMPAGRKNNMFVYLWAHEYGTDEKITHILARNSKGFVLIRAKKPWALDARPFFEDGLKKGIDKGSDLASGEIYTATDLTTISERAPYVSTGPAGMGGLLPSLFPTSMAGLIWYVVPPSQLYAVIGMASDIAGFLKGSFMSFGIAGGYARQYAWGQMGITKKVFRRKFRGRLWYGD